MSTLEDTSTEVKSNEIVVLKDEQVTIKNNLNNLYETVASMANIVLSPVLPEGINDLSYNDLKEALDADPVNMHELPSSTSNDTGNNDQSIRKNELRKVLKQQPQFSAQLFGVISQSNALESHLKKVDQKIDKISNRVNDVEQYGRLFNLFLNRVTGCPYKAKGFVFTEYIVNLLNLLFHGKLYRPVTMFDICKSHPVKKNEDGTHVVIVRFVIRDMRDEIYYKRRHLRTTNTGITVSENLTSDNYQFLKKCRDSLTNLRVWTEQAVVYADVNGVKTAIKTKEDLDGILKLSGVVSNYHLKRVGEESRSARYPENRTSNNFGVDLSTRGNWPELLQMIDYSHLSNNSPMNNSRVSDSPRDNYLQDQPPQNYADYVASSGNHNRGNFGHGRGNRGRGYHRGRGLRK